MLNIHHLMTFLLLLLPQILTEECKTCLELSTDNLFIQNLFNSLLDNQVKCNNPVVQQCSGHKPDCVSAAFTVSDSALGAKFKVRVAQCSLRSVWDSLYYRSSLGNALGDVKVEGEVDVDVWNEENVTENEENVGNQNSRFLAEL